MRELVSEAVAIAQCRPSSNHLNELWPQERATVMTAVAKRRFEFASGRACAHQALAALNLDSQPIHRGPHGEPVWPTGVVGSITHTQDYVAAAVANATNVAAIGIDAEPDTALPAGVLDVIATSDEQAALMRSQADVNACDRLLFCAKEAMYKAWFPVARRWLGFDDVRVEFSNEGTFAIEVLVPGPIHSVKGRYISVDGLVKAVVEIPRLMSDHAVRDATTIVVANAAAAHATRNP